MSLSDIVSVSIDVSSKTPQRIGFGTLMIVGPNAPWGSATERVRTFSDIDAVTDPADGMFSATDPEAIAAAKAFSQNPAPDRVKIGYIDVGDADAAATLDAIEAIDEEWYGLVWVSHSQATIIEIADWVEPRTKLFFTGTESAGVLDPGSTSDNAFVLQAAAYRRSAIIYNDGADTNFPEGAFSGRGLPTDPGSITWMFKDLATLVADELTTTEADAALAKNCNTFEAIKNIRLTREGKVASGEFIDVVRGADWLEDLIATRVFALLANEPKVPFTNSGINQVRAEVEAALRTGVARDVIATEPEFTVTVPDVLDVDPADRANRILRDVEFEARLAGAIHKVIISGRVTV